MRIAVPKETDESETRCAATPDSVAAMSRLGLSVAIERGLGDRAGLTDEAFAEAGAEVLDSPMACLDSAAVVLRVGAPPADQIVLLQPGMVHAGFLDPFNNPTLARTLAERGITAVSLELLPRTTLAQKMDALSSQHSLSGYYMVILAAERLGKALPMMVTPSGTIQPARVLVIGAGVAGLQAIATAKRLGARVEAFDTRPAAAEQVRSLGAKFIEVDLGETGETEGGYAKELTEEQRERQTEAMAKACRQADIVITTAQLFGRPAPRIIDRSILEAMKPGAVVIDYAAGKASDGAGNVESSVADEEVLVGPARIIGMSNYPGRIAADASRMYANNLAAFVSHIVTPAGKSDGGEEVPVTLNYDLNDELLRGCTVTHEGKVIHPLVLEKLGSVS